MITANHVPTGPVTLSGVAHAPVPGTAVRLDHAPGVPTDLKLFRIQTDPGLTTLSIPATTPANGSDALLFGNGRNRGAATIWSGESGFAWAPGNTLRWGTNRVEQTGLDVDVSGSRVRSLVFEFDAGLPTPHEAMAATGDSGGAVFIGSSLAGVIYAISTFQGQPAQTALYGNAALAADLSYYRPAILAVTAERACDDGVDDDGDGAIDLADPGCFAGGDAFETNAIAPCDDGFDSDGDGLVDWPDDPGCKDLTWLYENPACTTASTTTPTADRLRRRTRRRHDRSAVHDGLAQQGTKLRDRLRARVHRSRARAAPPAAALAPLGARASPTPRARAGRRAPRGRARARAPRAPRASGRARAPSSGSSDPSSGRPADP